MISPAMLFDKDVVVSFAKKHDELLEHTLMPPTSLYGIVIGQPHMHMAQELLPFTYGSMQWLPGELNITLAQMSPSRTASEICDM